MAQRWRTISVKIKNTSIKSFTSKHGVPQGSSLSRVLFIIYVSDIPQPENVQTTLSQFVDDIALWAYGRTTTFSQHKIQKHLDKIMRWCNIWRIRLNPFKTKVLNFSKKRHLIMDCPIKMGNKLKSWKISNISWRYIWLQQINIWGTY